MRKLILQEWLSVDGFTADRNGQLDFVADKLNSTPKIVFSKSLSTPGLAKFIMNLLFKLQQPPIPMKDFTDVQEAKEWLKQYL